MEANHPNHHLADAPPPAPDAPTPEPGEETAVTRYTVSTTVKPTVRLFNGKTAEAAHAGAVRSGSIRVGALPKTERLLRSSASIPPVEPGWTRPASTKPFVTRSFSGVRIRSGEPATAPAAPEDATGS